MLFLLFLIVLYNCKGNAQIEGGAVLLKSRPGPGFKNVAFEAVFVAGGTTIHRDDKKPVAVPLAACVPNFGTIPGPALLGLFLSLRCKD